MEFETEFQIESWVLYGVALITVTLRFALRVWKLGIKKLQLDDGLMLVVMGFFTLLVVPQNYVVRHESVFGPTDNISPAQLDQLEKNLKLGVVFEQAMVNVIYGAKACILIMVGRLIFALRERRGILFSITCIYSFLSYLATQIAFWTTCTPVSAQWTYPPVTEECATYIHYYTIQLVFNVSSDILILIATVPLLVKTNLPYRQRMHLIALYSMSMFIIVAAILTKVYQFNNADSYGYTYSYISWYVREASTAVYLSNLPVIAPILYRFVFVEKSNQSLEIAILPAVDDKEIEATISRT